MFRAAPSDVHETTRNTSSARWDGAAACTAWGASLPFITRSTSLKWRSSRRHADGVALAAFRSVQTKTSDAATDYARVASRPASRPVSLRPSSVRRPSGARGGGRESGGREGRGLLDVLVHEGVPSELLHAKVAPELHVLGAQGFRPARPEPRAGSRHRPLWAASMEASQEERRKGKKENTDRIFRLIEKEKTHLRARKCHRGLRVWDPETRKL